MSISHEIELRGETTQLDRMIALCQDKQAMNEQVGFYAMRFVQDHLLAYNAAHGNELGGPRTNFYSQCAASTTNRPDDSGASVFIAHVGMRLQYQGGTVLPGRNVSRITGEPTKLLTIPNVAAAHGVRVAQWENLKIVWGKDKDTGKPRPIGLGDDAEKPESGLSTSLSKPARNVLAKEMRRLKGLGQPVSDVDRWKMKRRLLGLPDQKEPMTIVYWLVKKAVIPPHPDVLPTAGAITSYVSGKLMTWLQRH